MYCICYKENSKKASRFRQNSVSSGSVRARFNFTIKLTCLSGEKSGKGVIDPASDDDHGQHVGHVTLHHVRHHVWIGHGIFHLRFPLVDLEITLLFVVEEVLSPQE